MSGVRRVGRQGVERLAPLDTRRRGAVQVGAQLYRAGRTVLREAPARLAVAGSGHADLRARHAAEAALVAEVLRHRRPPVPLDLVVVDGDPAALGRTLASLDAQLLDTATRHVVARAAVAPTIAALPPDRWVMVLAAGDTLTPAAVFGLLDAAWADPALDAVVGQRRSHGELRIAPSWSPELLVSANPYGHAVAMRASRWAGWDPTSDAWWAALLDAELDAGRVHRIDDVILEEAPPAFPLRPPLAAAGRHVARTLAAVHVVNDGGRLRVRFDGPPPSATVIVPTRHNRPLLEKLLPSLAVTEHPDWELIIVDNGGRTDEREAWYREALAQVRATVMWWDEPFNFSRVNNVAASTAAGDVLVFLNDDTVVDDPAWLATMTSWAVGEGIGTVGVRLLDAEDRIQHGGVVLGMSGFADHLFAGLRPGDDTLLGSTDWYRNALACTAACVAITRRTFEEIGGYDERFELLGSDVVVGLDCVNRGLRNVVLPDVTVHHLEATTREGAVPVHDMFASYWRYQRWWRMGDPYYSSLLSLAGPTVRAKLRGEPPPLEAVGAALQRSFGVFRQSATEAEATMLADMCRISEAQIQEVAEQHRRVGGYQPVRTVNWYLPDIENPFYGGIATILRLASHLSRHHGVENRYVCWAGPNEAWVRSALDAFEPGLGDATILFTDGREIPAGLPDCDVAVATQWPTAYMVARAPGARRKAYMVQDFEPMFHPAGTMYALAEETYKMGLYGICNTDSMADFYRGYGGVCTAFRPAVDREVFHAEGRPVRRPDDPVTVFLYARPGHWRNCWELVSLALDQLKERHGERLRIVTAGAWARPDDLARGIEHLGLLDYRSTGDLYRSADIGISLTVSPHPSYLPMELMACGAAVVAFDLPPGYWILRDGETCLLARRTVNGLVEQVDRLIDDPVLRDRIAAGGTALVQRHHDDWEQALSRVYHFLCEPERFGR